MSKAFVSTARAAFVSTAVAFAFCVLIGRLFYACLGAAGAT